MTLKQFTLSRRERLKSRKQIDMLFRQGNHLNVYALRVSYILSKADPADEPLQFGIGVSGKYFKRAVDRNRIKRLARESWRLQKNELKKILLDKQLKMVLFIVYTGRDMPQYGIISQSMSKVIEKLYGIANEAAEANT